MLVWDIETVARDDKGYIDWKLASLMDKRLKDPAKIELNKIKALDKLAIYPLSGKIILSMFLTDNVKNINTNWEPLFEDNDGFYVRQIGLQGEDEVKIIRETWVEINNACYDNGDMLITYNGKKFDMPYLMRRAILLGISPADGIKGGIILPKSYMDKYSRYHIDLAETLNLYGEYNPLVEWSYLIGVSDTLERDSDMIGNYYNDKDYEAIVNHCKADIWKTAMLYKKAEKWIEVKK